LQYDKVIVFIKPKHVRKINKPISIDDDWWFAVTFVQMVD